MAVAKYASRTRIRKRIRQPIKNSTLRMITVPQVATTRSNGSATAIPSNPPPSRRTANGVLHGKEPWRTCNKPAPETIRNVDPIATGTGSSCERPRMSTQPTASKANGTPTLPRPKRVEVTNLTARPKIPVRLKKIPRAVSNPRTTRIKPQPSSACRPRCSRKNDVRFPKKLRRDRERVRDRVRA